MSLKKMSILSQKKIPMRVLEELRVIYVLVDTFRCIIGKNNSDFTKHQEQIQWHTNLTFNHTRSSSETVKKVLSERGFQMINWG
jgi:hypothetical protein